MHPVWPEAAAWRVPAPALRRLRVVETTVVTALAVVVVVATTAGSTAGLTFGLAGAGVGGLLLGWLLLRRVGAWAYAERDEDLLVRRGVLIRRLSVIPYGRMQFVDITAGPFERIFGLATVKLHTAAAASDVRIPGLPGPEADRLRDRLTELGEARATGL